MKYKIGIISDTHDILKEEVINGLKGCDYILHAGDITNEDILLQLKEITRVIAVKGNNDQLDLNEEEYFTIGQYKFYMIHQKGKKKNVDFYIYGHSHKYEHYCEDNTVYLNPGGCGRKRFSLPLTFIILYINDLEYRIERKDLK